MPMLCEEAQDKLGPLVDGELTTSQYSEVQTHLDTCPGCEHELQQLSRLVRELERLKATQRVVVPPQLWSKIQARLDAMDGKGRTGGVVASFFRRPMAAAAGLMVFLGVATFVGVWLNPGGRVAQASTLVDYTILLDNLGMGVDAAMNRFLDYYHAQPVSASEAKAVAASLSFDLPADLPSGHRLEQVYRLKFGDSVGIAARYRKGTEPLVVFFHPPVDREHLGVHREMPCVVGQHKGQQIEVGPWRLIHFTDPTTCHCLLSRLDSEADLRAVFTALAPQFQGQPSEEHSMHGHN